MKFYILDKEIELKNEKESIFKIFDTIREVIEEEDYNFTYMIIDDKDIYDEFEDYIEENIEDINEIRAVLYTLDELVYDDINTIKEYIQGAIPLASKLSDEFYKIPDEQNVNDLNSLLEGSNWIVYTSENIDTLEKLPKVISNDFVWKDYIKEIQYLKEILEELKEAMRNNDNTTTGDILSLKIIPAFKKASEKLEEFK